MMAFTIEYTKNMYEYKFFILLVLYFNHLCKANGKDNITYQIKEAFIYVQ